TAKRVLRTSGGSKNTSIEFVNGCCYGRDDQPYKKGYTKLCGQRFWEFISGDPDLYEELIEPLEHGAKEGNKKFKSEYGKTFRRLVADFHAQGLAKEDGSINWRRLVQFASKAKSQK
ncbi:MAG TPA: PmeII family type II restriction endonuclease, partial [Xanthobacteraceae bacterium]|nr:PmeII family type II restriction endonuclease [Xanthobacteraceae bacterium]